MACDVCMGINSKDCPVCGKERAMVKCPECGGEGYVEYYAVNLDTGDEIEVKPFAWRALPGSEDKARHLGQRYVRGFREKCRRCGGTGTVEEDEDQGGVDDDYAMDRYYERKYGRY